MKLHQICRTLLTIPLAMGFAPLNAQVWRQIGPAPLQDNILLTSTPNATESRLVTDIAIDPRGTTDSTIYIATDNGGVWRTSDGGKTWTPRTDFMPSLAIGAVALDPSNPSIVYAGTGSYVSFADFSGVGLYKSTDGGNTWTVLNPNGIFTPPGTCSDGRACVDINRIVPGLK